MPHTLNFKLSPKEAFFEQFIKSHCSRILKCDLKDISEIKIIKKSIDARSKKIWINLKVDVYLKGEKPEIAAPFISRSKSFTESCIVVGLGPAGMFAALQLIEQGIKPIVIERGKKVRDRRRDLALINREHRIDSDSNYCFGEGGAGTFSDGKLYTRSKKRGDISRVLQAFIEHGANPNIAYESDPHIGTNKLPAIVENIRETILSKGGEIHFENRVTDFIVENGKFKAVICNEKYEYPADSCILATGHSARDIFELLDKRNIKIEAKPFALGVRIEHPQNLIDSIQYKCVTRSPYLPPSNYKLVSQQGGRGVFSFCMCPGGIIAPAATNPGEIVVNGWSPSKRNGLYANSGMVVSVTDKDFEAFSQFGELRAMKYQESIEKEAFKTNMDLSAPGQRMDDFIRRKQSASLAASSYIPGAVSRELDEVLPKPVAGALRDGLAFFGKRMRGYRTNEAMLLGVESRTSSPVRIPREKETLQHPEIHNLYPCGEGAGYAGGIMSAALDGIACANAIVINASKNS
jgi:uncharacterized FAD-dependent dehydrogenase